MRAPLALDANTSSIFKLTERKYKRLRVFGYNLAEFWDNKYNELTKQTD